MGLRYRVVTSHKGSRKSLARMASLLMLEHFQLSTKRDKRILKFFFYWQVWFWEILEVIHHPLMESIPPTYTSATVSHCGLIWLPSTLLLTTLFWFLRSVRTDRNTQYDILFTQMKSLLQIHLTAEWKIAISEMAVNLILNLFRVNEKHFCSLLAMFVVLPVLIPRSCYMARWVYWDQSSN